MESIVCLIYCHVALFKTLIVTDSPEARRVPPKITLFDKLTVTLSIARVVTSFSA